MSLTLVAKHQILDLNGLGLLLRHTSQSSGEVEIAFREQTLDKCAPEYIITCILYHKLVAILFIAQSLMRNITAYGTPLTLWPPQVPRNEIAIRLIRYRSR